MKRKHFAPSQTIWKNIFVKTIIFFYDFNYKFYLASDMINHQIVSVSHLISFISQTSLKRSNFFLIIGRYVFTGVSSNRLKIRTEKNISFFGLVCLYPKNVKMAKQENCNFYDTRRLKNVSSKKCWFNIVL